MPEKQIFSKTFPGHFRIIFLKSIRGLVQLGSSLPSQRHYAHLMLSHEHRLYLIHIVIDTT
nr:MAG TPA: hypothetical protein [Caudoviricetes sp.]